MSVLPTSNNRRNEIGPGSTTNSNVISESWQQQLSTAIRDLNELLAILELSAEETLAASPREFPLLVPHSFARRMQPRDANDPLLRQVLPTTAELKSPGGFEPDPVGDLSATKAPGMLQKYHGRALLITSGACAVHCRYCFRREFPYQHAPRRLQDWQPALDEIAADSTLTEIILSGGDPLMLSDHRLAELVCLLTEISHVERIRIHTRLPIVLPARVTPKLISMLREIRCQSVVVVHANHGNEVAQDCAQALQSLVRSGIPVLNQAVLLKGINDSAVVQEELCRRLVNLGVMPYYLHQLDRVAGAAHFECAEDVGREIIEALRLRLPGYAVPRLVQEIPGEGSKTPLSFN